MEAGGNSDLGDDAFAALTSLNQHQQDGRRSPHKPLLVLLALGEFAATGTSWFNFGGPDSLDNGLALCALHHRLFDRGAVGLDANCRVQVSEHFSARTDQGKRVYELHDRPLRPRPGTAIPAEAHVNWHNSEVFKGGTLAT